ncbi:MAG TPA: hypothetical protein DHN29_04755 [Cytophagales bacterium]|nr:hypothetical protein [Cytophagales bacterium]|tara:strand:- start:1390 stop:1575 length:186 start_codon:yes stop_codon:yes gene_type:complete
MKPGDLVRINCDNDFLRGQVGVVILDDHDEENPHPYGLCVMLNDRVYGFLPREIEIIDECG